ncbi:unnamed protein product [Prunus armeniaca]|uniref:Uncharacterized protein n=1 Tax=Prunus armeniaca TaxID=36596 RepID=A0A6J5TPP0_PRUAR|nr:unnamed protein product [Prunus armeniaca]
MKNRLSLCDWTFPAAHGVVCLHSASVDSRTTPGDTPVTASVVVKVAGVSEPPRPHSRYWNSDQLLSRQLCYRPPHHVLARAGRRVWKRVGVRHGQFDIVQISFLQSIRHCVHIAMMT